MRAFVKISVVILGSALWLTASCGKQRTANSQQKSVEDVSSMVQQQDGTFRVTCFDGRIEIRTAQEIRENRVCIRGGGGGGGGGGTNGLLRCVARDNDGRDPWVLSVFSPDGRSTKLSDFVFGTIEVCQAAINDSRTIYGGPTVTCATKDRDGRNPFAFGLIQGQTGKLVTDAILGDAGQCADALRKSRQVNDFIITCVSRDRDGKDPWVNMTINRNGNTNMITDNVYGNFQQCLNSI